MADHGQSPILDQTSPEAIRHEIEVVDHSIVEIEETNGEDPSDSGFEDLEMAGDIFAPPEAIKDEIERKKREDILVLLHQIAGTRFRPTSIFKVHAGLRESNPAAYTPKLISIGPYHNKSPNLCSMEKYKWFYLERFLNRKEEINDQSCLRELEKLKDEALMCYGNKENLDKDIICKFSEIMLLDGCFLVEFIRENFAIWSGGQHYQLIIDKAWMIKQVCRDMVVLENQLPYFVLTKLHDMTKCPNEESFLYMVRRTLLEVFPKMGYIPEIDCLNTEPFDHLLHVIHKVSCPFPPRPSEMIKSSEGTDASKKKGFCNINIFFGKILQRMNRSEEIPPRPSEMIKSSQGTDAGKKKEFCNINISFGKILQRMKRSKEIPPRPFPPRPSEMINSSEGTDASKKKGFCNINIFFGKILQRMKRSKEIPPRPSPPRPLPPSPSEMTNSSEGTDDFCLPPLSQSEMTNSSEGTDASKKKGFCNINIFFGQILQRMNRSKENPDIPSLWHWGNIPSATELYEAGVSFTKIGSVDGEDTTSLLDIKYESGLLEIPCFLVGDSTEIILRNLIAYEQHLTNVNPSFTDYQHIMNQLIDSPEDVKLLRESGIIINYLGDDKAVANFFNKLGDGVLFDSTTSYYKEVCCKLNQHCQKRWNKILANLRHNYFHSLWAGTSTVAAIVLLILTAIQTVLAFTGSVK